MAETKHQRWVVKLQVTDQEREQIARAADAERMTIGAWIGKIAVQKARATLASGK
jgi:uncharacterized protein (DUF1778 family)